MKTRRLQIRLQHRMMMVTGSHQRGESSTELALPLDQMTAAEKLRACVKRYLEIQFPEGSSA